MTAKHSWQRFLIGFAALAALALGALPCGCGGTDGTPPPAQGSLSPDAFLRHYGLKGRVALVEFGMIGCEKSEQGLLEMARMRRENTLPGVSYVRVESTTDKDAAAKYFAEKAPSFPLHYDPEDALAKYYSATARPTFVLLDKFGNVRYRGAFPEPASLKGWTGTLMAEYQDPGSDALRFGEASNIENLLAETKLPDTQGRVDTLAARMGKKGMLVIFVDTSCPYSGTAIGETPTVSAKLASYDIATVLVNLGDDAADVKKFYAAHQTGTPVLYDETERTQKAWTVSSVPTVVLFDAAGKPAYRGNAVWDNLARAAESTLGLPDGSVSFAAQGTEYG